MRVVRSCYTATNDGLHSGLAGLHYPANGQQSGVRAHLHSPAPHLPDRYALLDIRAGRAPDWGPGERHAADPDSAFRV